jgi:hypothetical protein
MSNWRKRIKTAPRRRGKHEFRMQTVYKNMEDVQRRSTRAKKGRHIYSMVIVPCSKCGKKFRIKRMLRDILDRQKKDKTCPICAKVPSKAYLMVSKKEQANIEKYHKANNCTVRKMTEEERKKYLDD